ncbi:MAG: hypothetical protein M1838_005748, partial [Thelocarpon superellum]
ATRETPAAPQISNGYVSKDAALYITTPLDPLFLILPALTPASKEAAHEERFLSVEDYFDTLSERSAHFAHLLEHAPTRQCLEDRLATVCDKVEAGDESMYRLNDESLLQQLLAKATRMVDHGLPASLEESLVRRALDAPVLSIKREATLPSGEAAVEDKAHPDSTMRPTLSADVSNLSDKTSESVESSRSIATAVTTPASNPGAEFGHIAHLLRVRTALHYLVASYIPPPLSRSLQSLLVSSSSIDFSPLDAHLDRLAELRREALQSRPLSDFALKRSIEEDDEASETRAEKKRKKDEEEKRKKAGESRGLRDLKKADVSGMKKMSAFFSVQSRAKK